MSNDNGLGEQSSYVTSNLRFVDFLKQKGIEAKQVSEGQYEYEPTPAVQYFWAEVSSNQSVPVDAANLQPNAPQGGRQK